MEVTLAVAYGKEAVDLAKKALQARLYVPGWDINPTLHHIIKTSNSIKYGVSVAYFNDVPIGVAIAKATWNGVVYVFVRKPHRNNGVGRKLVMSLLKDYEGTEYPVGHENGSKGCVAFFSKLGLDIIENYSEHY